LPRDKNNDHHEEHEGHEDKRFTGIGSRFSVAVNWKLAAGNRQPLVFFFMIFMAFMVNKNGE